MSVRSNIVVCDNCGRKNRVMAAAIGVPRCGQCKTALTWITDAGDSDFDAVVLGARVPVLVDLWAPWCGPCKSVSPELEKLARRFAGKLKLVKVDVDQSPGVARRYDARSIPMLLVVSDGTVVGKRVGAAGEQSLQTWLESLLPS